MDWDKLRIFHAVAEAGSFTKAGDTLNLSQSAISRQISSLEESLNVILFHRHARGLLLTEQGQILEKAAREIFGKLAMIEGQIADSKQQAEGPLRVTTTEFIGSTWLAPHIVKFKSNFPDIQLSMLLDNRIYDLGMSEADVAIRLYKPEHPDLIQLKLGSIRFHIYGSKDYLKKNGTPETPNDLQNHVLIGYPDNTHQPYADTNWLLKLAGVDSENNSKLILMNSMSGIARAVKTGAGLAMLPDFIASNNPQLIPVLKDCEPKQIEMFFVYPEERRHSQRISIFRDFLTDLVAKTDF
jgi:DNA-binding transcriptional LysR family regulator